MGQRAGSNGAGGKTGASGMTAVTEVIGAATADLAVGEATAGRAESSTGTAADLCVACGAEQSAIRINVDGNTLLMESCDECDIRRWQLEGKRIDLQEALNQVGEHSGRRRSRS